MAKSFMIGNDEIVFEGPVVEYNELKIFSDETITELSHKYQAQILNIDDADEAKELFLSISSQLTHEYYMSFSTYFLNKGMFDFSEDNLDNSSKFEWANEPVINAVSEYSDTIDLINGDRDEDFARREMRKESRGRVIGGGFGLEGAIGGMVTAGAMNLATGLAHSAFNLIGDSISAYSAYSKKHKVLDVFKKQFISSLIESTKRIFLIINEQLETTVQFDTRKAENITNNVIQGKLKGDIVSQALRSALLADPYYGEAYVTFTEKYPDLEKDIISVAKFFHADLGDAYTILNFTFSSRMNTEIAKAFLKGIDYQIDALTCEGFHDNLYNFDTLISKRCLVITQLYINLFKKELDKTEQESNDEIADFKQYVLHRYESLRENIIKFCHDNGFQIGKLSMDNNPSEIAIYLAVNDIQKELDYMYFGDIIPTKILQHYCTKINKNASPALNSQIYIFSCEVYDEDSDDDNELMATDEDKCLIFCDKGFGGRVSMFSQGFVPFDEINNVYFSNRMKAATLKINSDISIGINFPNNDWERCADVTRHIITTLTGKTLTNNFFNSDSKNSSEENETTSSSNNKTGLVSSIKSASLSTFNKVTEIGTSATESILNKNTDKPAPEGSKLSSFTSSIFNTSKSAFGKVTDVGSKATSSIFSAAGNIKNSITSGSTDEMKCPNCGAAIAKGKKFCGNCGTKIIIKQKITCPNCGAEIAEGKKFCGMCGAKILSQQKSICPVCGTEIAEGKKFCGNCGTKVL